MRHAMKVPLPRRQWRLKRFMGTSHRNRALAVAAATALAAFACGSKSGLKSGAGTSPTDAPLRPSETGGSPGLGGTLGGGAIVGSGGVSGNGGVSAVGGSFGFGGVPAVGGSAGATAISPADAWVGVSCIEDGGRGLPSAARRCTQDGDCTIGVARNCCGPDDAFGEAQSQVDTYASCLMRIGLCGAMGCSKTIFPFVTDTGRVSPAGAVRALPDSVVVHCVNQLCTTDVMDTVDGGQDAPAVDAPAADAALDARQPCGDASCGPGQACFLIAGGAVPLCLPAGDAGTCGTDMVRVASCSVGSGPTRWEPGCTTPPPSPQCYDIPDACADPCSCVCPSRSPWGCGTGPGYLTCPAQ